jgi:hypothetical protein
MPFARGLLVGSNLLNPKRTFTEPFSLLTFDVTIRFREQTKCPPHWAAPAAKNGTFWEVIYGSASHCPGSVGVRDVFRGA